MADQFPEKFDKYKIIEEVGRGGFADVYKAIDTTLDRTVALKFLEPQLLREPTFAERFQREAKLAANLKHPNIVFVHEFGWEAGTIYIAMEFLEGWTLKEVILEEGALPLRRIVNMVGQMASALDYAHRRGLVHRDIKPSNIMVGASDHVTVMDFGIAKAATLTALTTTGKIFGTPEYMSPEQAEGLEEPDARSDIYSLGVVVYEMITGKVPFSGTTPLSIMRGHADKPPPRPAEINPDVSPAVEAVLLKALAKKREERYQSAGEMAVALQQAASRAVVEELKAPAPLQPVTPSDETFPTVRKAELVVVTTPLWLVGPEGQSYELKPGSLTLGRAKGCDIQVNDPQVSRQHAKLEFDGQKCTIYDEGSANGTFVNGQRVGAEGLPFKVGDRLRVGTTNFSLSATVSPRPLIRKDERPVVDEEAVTAGVPPLAAPLPMEPAAVAKEKARPPTALPALKAVPKKALSLGGGLAVILIAAAVYFGPGLMRALLATPTATPTNTWTPTYVPAYTPTATFTYTPTAYPTYTPYPTYTSVPTDTPVLPTPIPLPPTGTPTPVPPTDTPTPTPTPIVPTPITEAVLTGRLVYTVYNTDLGYLETVVVTVDGKHVLSVLDAIQPAFSPDGEWLAFRSLDPGGIGVMNLETRARQTLTGITQDIHPGFDPGSHDIVFSRDDHLYLVDVVSRPTVREVGDVALMDVGIAAGRFPDWCRVAHKEPAIVYSGFAGGGRFGLMLTTPVYDVHYIITQEPGDLMPAWSPDCTRIAFAREEDGNWDIYVINPDGSGRSRLTSDGTMEFAPVWSPAGDSIAFLSNRDGRWAVWVMDPNGQNPRKLIEIEDRIHIFQNPLEQCIDWAP